MRTAWNWGIAATWMVLVCAAQTSAPARKTPAKNTTASKTSTAAKQASTKAGPTTARKSPKKTAPVHTAAARPPRQLQPTAQRYREIQDALVAKGYLQPGQASGNWDPTSIDALKRFQADQKLDASGRITSMSLIALGLGPKHQSTPLPAPAAPQEER